MNVEGESDWLTGGAWQIWPVVHRAVAGAPFRRPWMPRPRVRQRPGFGPPRRPGFLDLAGQVGLRRVVFETAGRGKTGNAQSPLSSQFFDSGRSFKLSFPAGSRAVVSGAALVFVLLLVAAAPARAQILPTDDWSWMLPGVAWQYIPSSADECISGRSTCVHRRCAR